MNGTLLRLAICCSIFFVPLISLAEIAGISGDITQIAPPPSVLEEALVSTTTMSVFRERENYSLPAALNVDVLGVGRGDTDPITPAPLAGMIPAGTRVDVYFVHFDRPEETFGALFGAIGFDAEVLGVIHKDESLDNSEFLGVAGTSYPTNLSERGMAQTIEQVDWVEVVNAPMGPPVSVRINSAVDVVLDQVRIITVASIVPEPAVVFMSAIGLLGALLVRPRRENPGNVRDLPRKRTAQLASSSCLRVP
jgi:hypothetical protein